MAVPTPRHDVAAGSAVTVWVLGMGLVLGTQEATWQVAGGCLWAAGFVIAGGVAGHAYLARRRPE